MDKKNELTHHLLSKQKHKAPIDNVVTASSAQIEASSFESTDSNNLIQQESKGGCFIHSMSSKL